MQVGCGEGCFWTGLHIQLPSLPAVLLTNPGGFDCLQIKAVTAGYLEPAGDLTLMEGRINVCSGSDLGPKLSVL